MSTLTLAEERLQEVVHLLNRNNWGLALVLEYLGVGLPNGLVRHFDVNFIFDVSLQDPIFIICLSNGRRGPHGIVSRVLIEVGKQRIQNLHGVVKLGL